MNKMYFILTYLAIAILSSCLRETLLDLHLAM